MKNTKGISLIVLIIIIIVMLILAGVIVTTAINGDLFTAAQEAKFKTEVSQIKESIETQKAIVIANNGAVPEEYVSEELISALPEELKEKYFDTKKLDILNGELYYIAQNLTENEIQWCKDLGIGEISIASFMNIKSKEHFDDTYNWGTDTVTGMVDLEAVRLDLKARYPDAIISYIRVSGEEGKPRVDVLSSEAYRILRDSVNKQDRFYQYCKSLNKKDITKADIQDAEILAIAEELKITFPTTLTKIELATNLKKSLVLVPVTLNTFYNDEHIYLACNPALNSDLDETYKDIEIEMMTKAEAEQMLTFEEAIYDTAETLNSGTYLKVTGYKTANPVVPGFVITSDNELQGVEEIASEAFAESGILKSDILVLFPIEQGLGKDYKDSTLEDVKNLVDEMLSEAMKVEEEKTKIETIKGRYTENTNENKDKLVMETLGYAVGIPAYSYDMENMQTEYFDKYFESKDGRIYAAISFNDSGDPTFNQIENNQKYALGNLTIQEGVKKIGARAFAGNLITGMYFPKSIEDATNALQDAMLANRIQTKLTKEQLKTVAGFADYYPFGSSGYGWNEVFEVIQ